MWKIHYSLFIVKENIFVCYHRLQFGTAEVFCVYGIHFIILLLSGYSFTALGFQVANESLYFRVYFI